MKPLGPLVRKLRRCSFGLNQLFTLLGLLGAAGLTACASAKVSPRTLDLSHRTGGYSYRQAVADLGRPDVAYQNHLSRLKYAAVNNVTGRQGVFNMGRNFSVKVNVPLEWKL